MYIGPSPFIPLIAKLKVFDGCLQDTIITLFNKTHLFLGEKSSPEIFHSLMQAIQGIMARQAFHAVVVCEDDCLVIAQSKEECQQLLINVIATPRPGVSNQLVKGCK